VRARDSASERASPVAATTLDAWRSQVGATDVELKLLFSNAFKLGAPASPSSSQCRRFGSWLDDAELVHATFGDIGANPPSRPAIELRAVRCDGMAWHLHVSELTDPSPGKSADRFQRTPGRLELLPEGYSAAGVARIMWMTVGCPSESRPRWLAAETSSIFGHRSSWRARPAAYRQCSLNCKRAVRDARLSPSIWTDPKIIISRADRWVFYSGFWPALQKGR
jgi:hypothetical protein